MRAGALLYSVYLGLVFAQDRLSFQVTSGDNDNFFLRDNTTTAQLLLTKGNSSSELRRLVVALPAGNSGALTYFIPQNNTDEQLTVTLEDGTFRSTTDDFDNVGIQANLKFSGNSSIGVTIIGAVRAMRDYVEGDGIMHEIFNYTLAGFNETFVKLHRQWINATTSGAFKTADFVLNTVSGARLNVTPSNNGTFTPPTIDILVDEGGGTIQMRFVTNETTIAGLSPEDLFLSAGNSTSPGVSTAVLGLANGTSANAQQVSFLTYKEKFTAGGWRFLTYFGRDSMIALRLLMPILTSDAIEAALGAVIERVNSTGALCHEETIGDYASFVNIGNNQSELGNQPFYDYKMIDTDLLLLPTMAHYFLDLPQGKDRAAAFLARNATLQTGNYGDLVNRTVNYNLERAAPFSIDPQVTSLLAFRPGQPVGNWRDSNQGTGYGPIPFDVNVVLVPASLRATARLARAGILFRNDTLADQADSMAQVWEEKASGFFEVTINASTAESRLSNFVQQANLSQALLRNATSTDVITGGNKVFFALSLMEDGSPVEVLNSDLGFNLLYGNNVTEPFIQRVVEALVSYPRGLLTNIGMVVANPAYDRNTTNIEVLNRGAYHGTVIWSWQQGLMAGGLSRQLSFCSNSSNYTVDVNPALADPPAWCANATFVQDMVDAQSRLWTSIKGGVNDLFSEVWTYSFDNTTNTFSVADLASISPDGTESDAIQLWSYGFLGLLDPDGLRVGQ